MNVRIGSREDLGRISALDPGRVATRHRAQLLRDRLRAADAWLAEEGAKILGYALRGQFFGFDFLELVYVAEPYRRAGVASALIDIFERARRTTRVFVSTNRSNEPMLRLLKARGYSPSGVIYNLDAGDPELFYVRRYNGEDVETA
jgi:GNAT superfamily N-acetyltransferase